MLAEAQAARIMGRAPCCSKVGLHRGPWTPHEDMILRNYISIHGEGQWRHLPKRAGLLRCGKSCRLRWLNCLRPNIKRGNITPDEEDLIIRLHRLLGNRWSLIAGRLPGRTDNEIKNFWNTRISRKLRTAGIDPNTHKPMHPVPCAGKNVPTQFPESNNYVTNNIVEGSSSSEKSEGNERAEQESEATRQKHEHENEYEDSWPSDCCMEDLVQNNWSLENNDFQFLLMDGSLEQLDYAAHLKHYESAQVGDDWLY